MPVKLNFTKRALEGLPAPSSSRALYHDATVRGLGLKIETSGHRTFFWFRKVRRDPTWKTIGRFPDLSVEEARAKAGEFNTKLAKWKASDYEGANPFERSAALTLDTLVDEYVARHLRDHAKRPEAAEKALRWAVGRYLHALRERRVDSIQPEEVHKLHRHVGAKHGHRTANHVVQRLRTLFNFAARARLWRGENPAKGVLLYREEKRARFLRPDELPKLWDALRRAPNPDLKDYVNLSLWTGARKMDVLSMRWQDVSLDDNRWTIPDPKSRVPYVVPLTAEAVEILKARRQAQQIESPYVFPSHGKSGHVTDLKVAWKRLLRDAGLDYADAPELRLRQHDLRRTQGSWQAAQGASLSVIGKSLGHQSVSATQIYARLDLEPVRASMAAANAAMTAAMHKKLPATKPKRLKAAPRD